MNNSILYLLGDVTLKSLEGLNTKLSLRPFIDFIRNKAKGEKTIKLNFFNYVLQVFEQYPELENPIELEELIKKEHILELMYSVISPPLVDENEEHIAFSVPFTPIVFYHTDALNKLLVDARTGQVKDSIAIDRSDYFQKNSTKFIYSIILERFYNIKLAAKGSGIVYTFEDEVTGLPRYFKVALDERFLAVYCDEAVPELPFEVLEDGLQENFDIDFLEKILPLHLFRFEGFSVINLIDVTATYAIENIKNILLNDQEDGFMQGFHQSLQSLLGSSDIKFGIFPLLKVNNKVVFDNNDFHEQFLFKKLLTKEHGEKQFYELLSGYLESPKLLFFRKFTSELVAKNPYIASLAKNQIKSYAIIPIYFNAQVAGVLEVYSEQEGLLNENILAKLDPAIPLIAQQIQDIIENFQIRLSETLQELYTPLQPLVQWKFNEMAWKYIQARDAGNLLQEAGKVLFKNVYPLYGEIDIKDSTLHRNLALQKDLREQFMILIEALEAIKETTHLDILEQLLFQSKKWLESINNDDIKGDRLWLDDFLSNEANVLFMQLKQNFPETAPIVNRYLKAIDEQHGVAFQHRRNMEKSMTMLNEMVSKTVEFLKNDILAHYPFYFEKFRTDGIEYDIYVGQSLAPDKPFNKIYLKNLRLWQMTSMAILGRQTNLLKNTMPVPLETTQLIFVHGSPINISFRNDERRFDVEGAYNIRYQMIKKRIDKVMVYGTQMRLTQPGKIAIVYLNRRDAVEYIKHIIYLQEQGLLMNDMEELDLEELQGVTGLKALRVGIKYT